MKKDEDFKRNENETDEVCGKCLELGRDVAGGRDHERESRKCEAPPFLSNSRFGSRPTNCR